MRLCSKCKIDKEDNNFYTYYHSVQKKYRTRWVCNYCLKEQKQAYLRRKLENEVKLRQAQEALLKSFKTCVTCNEAKPPESFYKSRGKKCKVCIKLTETDIYKNREGTLDLQGGTMRVPPKPGIYADKYQQHYTRLLLEAMGWTYNEENNIFYKDGIKDKDGNWQITFHGEYRGDMKRQSINVRKNMTPAQLPRLKIYKSSSREKYTEDTVNKMMYEFFIDKIQLKDISEKYGISIGTILYFTSRVYDKVMNK